MFRLTLGLTLITVLVAKVSPKSFEVTKFEETQWQKFKKIHNKTYPDDEEERKRFGIFQTNMEFIEEHNRKFDSGDETFTLKINRLADMSSSELVHRTRGLARDWENLISKNDIPFIVPENIHIPDEFDWRLQGAVTQVRDQGHCGSCYAFSAIGSLEGQLFRLTGNLTSLSEQHLLDCSSQFGNSGCQGGTAEAAYDFIKSNGGISTEKSYPYRANSNQVCSPKANKSLMADIIGYVKIPRGSEEKLRIAVATMGPVSIAVDATRPPFSYYKDGIHYDAKCSKSALSHAVLVVGYGTDKTIPNGDYWIVKNNWGSWYGDEGYIKMARNRRNNCGIATQALYPLIRRGNA